MDIHPLLIHFPIVTFSIYGIIEIFALDKKFHSLLGTKRLLLVVSFISALPTIMTGLQLEDNFEKIRGMSRIVELHQSFAIAFTIVTGLLVLGMIGAIIKGKNIIMMNWWQKILSYFAFLGSRPVRLFLAIIGFILIIITGALGGLIVYGPSIDPLSAWLYGVIVK